jgi:crotonobetainyl-CoA:carnitine CoA-transferase CaiB-like acyl-CoA transferase
VHFSATPVEYRNAPPMLGQDTIPVLRQELGLQDEDIRELQLAGVI